MDVSPSPAAGARRSGRRRHPNTQSAVRLAGVLRHQLLDPEIAQDVGDPLREAEVQYAAQ